MSGPEAAPAPGDPLSQCARRDTIQILARLGVLRPRARDEALALIRPPGAWVSFLRHLLLGFGLALILAGIVFFFAYNWARMGAMLKFGLIEGGIAACVVGALKLGLDRLSGKALAFAAAVLVGVFLAVFGQTYQTGADAFDLFAGWAALILGWAVLARFAPLWLFWLILVNVAVILYAVQVYGMHGGSFEWLLAIVGALNAAALAAKEALGLRRSEGFRERWPRWLMLPAATGPVLIPVLVLVVHAESIAAEAACAALYAVFSAAAWWFFRYRARDLGCLALVLLGACVLACVAVVRGIWELWDEIGRGNDLVCALFMLVTGVAILGIFAGSAAVLVWTWKRMGAEAKARAQATSEAGGGPDA